MIDVDFSNTWLNKAELIIIKKLKRKSYPYDEKYGQLMLAQFINVEAEHKPDMVGGITTTYGNMSISEKGLAYLDYLKVCNADKFKALLFDVINLIIALSGLVFAIINAICG